MRNLAAMLLAIVVVLGGIPLAVTVMDEDPATRSPSEASDGGQASSNDARASATQDDEGASSTETSEASGQRQDLSAPRLRPSQPGATPLEMTANLLGPVPEDLRRVDPSLSLQEAMRRHPAFPDAPAKTPGLAEGPTAQAMSRLVQAHGVLTEVLEASSKGDKVARKLVPYAAAQLATEARRAAPALDTTSTLLDLQQRSELTLNGHGEPVEQAASLQSEVDRLYGSLGLPTVQASPMAGEADQLARIVHATADVVQATQEAKHAMQIAGGLQEDLDRVNRALEDGALSPKEARTVQEVATLVHETTVMPLQARLDALETLYATTEQVVPRLSAPASHSPQHQAQQAVGDARNRTEDAVQQAENDTEQARKDAEQQARQLRNRSEEQARQARDTVNETIRPVQEKYLDNFVDPLGAIYILGEGNDHVNNTGSPVPIQIPGAGPVGSLFPRSPVLVIDRGGDDVYTGLPRSHAARDTVNESNQPPVEDEQIPAEDVIFGAPVPGGSTTSIVRSFKNFGGFLVDVAENRALQEASIEATLTLDTPAQVVVDLAGDDRYEGDKGAAYAAGGGTAAVFDRKGSDTYEVDKGIGLIQEDGFALVKDLAGDDRYRAQTGIGSVIQPFRIVENEPRFQERFRMRLGGLGGLVDLGGDDAYSVSRIGLGVGFHQGTKTINSEQPLLPLTVPVVIDTNGANEGFQPNVLGAEPAPSVTLEKTGGRDANVWLEPGKRLSSGNATNIFSTIFITLFAPDQLEHPPFLKLTAAERSYQVDLGEPTDGRIQVSDHNVTLELSLGSLFRGGSSSTLFADGSSFSARHRPHTNLVMNLQGKEDVYEPPFPLILVDAGNSTDTFINATPTVPLERTQDGRQTLLDSSLASAPMFVLDTSGDDRWLGQVGAINSTVLQERIATGTMPSAASVLVDNAGDDVYRGNVSSIDLNYTGNPLTATALVHDASGSDVIEGGIVGGVRVHNIAMGNGAGTRDQLGHSVNDLLLFGVDDLQAERDRVTADAGSLGSVYVDTSDLTWDEQPGIDAVVTDFSRLKAAAIQAAPTSYVVGNHSLGSVHWCENALPGKGEPCPLMQGTLTGSSAGLLVAPGDPPPVQALFVGSVGSDDYTVETSEGLGHVTMDERFACEGRQVPFVPGLRAQVPQILTRFVDVAGGDSYQIQDRNADLPPWRNDDAWRTFECKGSLERSPQTTSAVQNRTVTLYNTTEAFTIGIVQPILEDTLSGSGSGSGGGGTGVVIETLETADKLAATYARITGQFAVAGIEIVEGVSGQDTGTSSIVESRSKEIAKAIDDQRYPAPGGGPGEDATETALNTTGSLGDTGRGVVIVVTETTFDALTQLTKDVSEDVDVREVDNQGIDNLAQYAAGIAALNAGRTVEDQNLPLVEFEPPRLCMGPYAEEHGITNSDEENMTRLRGFEQDACATPTTKDRFLIGQPITSDKRLVLTTRTRNTVPANLVGLLNPCDIGRRGGAALALEARASNTPEGNPLAHGTSGCWATLNLTPTMTKKAGPVWNPLTPTGNGSLDVLAGSVDCGLTDENNILRCSTDAFPLPYHVDGTSGRNQGRWFLPEGTYQYCLRFHGPITAFLGGESRIGCEDSARLRIDRLPLEEAGPVEAFPASPTQKPAGLLTWLQKNEETVREDAPSAFEGFRVRAVSQRSTGEPREVEVWSPLNLATERDVVPAVCVDGTPYRGQLDDAEATWHGDLGVWATTYPLTPWRSNDALLGEPPESCDATAQTSSLTKGPNDVQTSLWSLASATPERIELPDEVTSEHLVVDDVQPVLDAAPLRGALGVDLDVHGLGLDDLEAPNASGRIDATELGKREGVSFELPIRASDESPMSELLLAGTPDHAWSQNVLPSAELTYERPDGERTTIDCNGDGPTAEVCRVRLNLTHAGPTTTTMGHERWIRHATVNVSFNLDESEVGPVASNLSFALEEAAGSNEPLELDLGRAEVRDEAGNRRSISLSRARIDLSPPRDLALPCGSPGTSLITTNDTAEIMTYIPVDDVEGLYVERQVNGSWLAQQWVAREDMVRVNEECEKDADGQFLRFTYTAEDAAEGSEVLHKLRTVPLDHVGNREDTSGPFEFTILFDQSAPSLSVHQTSAEPHEIGVSVSSREPVQLGEDTVLHGPQGQTIAPIDRPVERSDEHTLRFEGLSVNTTYTLEVTAQDKAELTNRTRVPVSTARTLNVSLAAAPDVAGEAVPIRWRVGALGPAEGGSPSIRVDLSALHQGSLCAQRSLSTFVEAPLEAPANRSTTLPIGDCPGGNLTLGILVENGEPDDPIETIALNTTVRHDVERPEPAIEVQGTKGGTGWYTSPVSVQPSGTDDTRITKARILTSEGPVQQLVLDESGTHEVTVRVEDAAGRTAQRTLRVPVDLARPQVQLVSQDPLPTERSVITVQVQGSDDASGLRSIRTRTANGAFTEWTPVVEGMQLRFDIRGMDVLLAEVRDRAGHVTQTVLPVTSLADPPKVTAHRITVDGPGIVRIEAQLDRPMPLDARVLQEGKVVAETVTNATRQHSITLEGLTPGSPAEVRVDARLSDGRSVRLNALTETVALPADGGPPTAPGNLTATVLDDGTVKLTWERALDDAGIDRYLVQRRTDGTVSSQWSVTDSRLLDDPAAATEHTYRVKAIDLAGRAGAWSNPVAVTPDVPLKILSYNVTPEVASQGTPVTITVIAQASQPPETARLEVGDRTVPLVLQDGGQGRWMYQANLTIPTTDTFFPKGVRVHLADETFPQQGTFPGPVVKALEDGEVSTSNPAPGPGLGLVLVAALLAGSLLAIRRRRWSP